MKKVLSVVIYTLVIVLVTALVASGATLLISSSVDDGRSDKVTISREEYETLKKYGKLSNIMTLVENKFVEDVTEDDLIEYAAYGMVAMLGDPYSYYLDTEAMNTMQEEDSGNYVGIGAVFTTDPDNGNMVVTRIYADSPASEGGIQIGDILYKVDGESIVGVDTTTVTAMVRGEEGTDIVMTVLRDGEEVDIPMTRRQVEKVELDYKLLEDGVLHITLSSFSTNADTGFEEAVKYGKENGMTGILLDLRGNPGGADTILNPIADLLLPEGVVYYTEDSEGNRVESKSDAYNLGLPVVVLCDENSASAAEVLIASLQDYKMATVVGTTTFGKAIGQSTYTVGEDGSGLHLTTVKVYSPLGRNWHGEGLEPDVVVEQPEELKHNPLLRNEENDTQYIEGLKILREQIAAK